MLVIAHRALMIGKLLAEVEGGAPGNSHEAIRYCMSANEGPDGIEIDVRETQDGEFVLCHDRSFLGKNISSTDIGKLRGIATLRQALCDIKGTMLVNVELKNVRSFSKLGKLLQAYQSAYSDTEGIADREVARPFGTTLSSSLSNTVAVVKPPQHQHRHPKIVVTSFHTTLLLQMRIQAPDVELGLLIEGVPPSLCALVSVMRLLRCTYLVVGVDAWQMLLPKERLLFLDSVERVWLFTANSITDAIFDDIVGDDKITTTTTTTSTGKDKESRKRRCVHGIITDVPRQARRWLQYNNTTNTTRAPAAAAAAQEMKL